MNKNAVINLVLFQLLWFAAVLGSSYGLSWPAYAFCITLLAWQLQPSRRHPTDLLLLITALLLGLFFDTLWAQLQLINYHTNTPVDGIAPGWIIAMWLGFSLTINHSLAWLKAKLWLAALFGFIGGPLSYYAGVKLGAITYLQSASIINLSLALAWGLAMFVLVKLSTRSQH